MNRTSPARSANLNSKLAPTSSHGRDLFRTSTPQSTRTTRFAPNLPADATRTTPSARKFVQKSTNGGMSSIASAELFKMRIPSPDPELSGEALSKEVPDDPNRTGTIYADQFLAHKCPPNFDDLQRRQFFCVLDLRRLKYAADEIFAKKDWKLNIMNFAKEYEKSRGMIMLRYGLYEFKNVKPSEEVLKRWRASHNLPDPSPEVEKASTTSTQNGRRAGVSSIPSTKRKAEDDLMPKDNALMASNANQNKRRNVTVESADRALNGPAPFKKGKRKADETDEPDENQPSKVQKPTPSAAKSKFESILDKSQSGNTSPLKRPSLTPFGSQKSTDSQSSSLTNKLTPFGSSTNGLKPLPANSTKESGPAGSVLSEHKVGSASTTNTGNIFSYLSDSSPGSSGNENENAENDDTESESEEESGSQETPPSNQLSAASSTDTNVPSTQNGASLFSGSKPAGTSNLFGGVDKSNDLASKGGLFGRVQLGSNGQPLRATANVSEQNTFASTKQPAPSPEKEQSKTPAKQPGDFTFNAATTPITFGQPAVGASKSSAATEDAESAKESDKPKDAPTAKQPSLFGAGAPTTSAFQPTPQSLFGAPSKPSDSSEAKPNAAASSIFSGQKAAPLSSSLFGSTTAKPVFGGAVGTTGPNSSAVKEQQKSAPAITTGSSDPTPEAEAKKIPSTSSQPSSIFGTPPTSTATAPQASSLFGGSMNKMESHTNGNTSSQPVSDKVEKSSTSSLFGGSSTSASFGQGNVQANGSGSAKSVFDTPKQPSTGFSFGNSKPEAGGEANGDVNGANKGTNVSSAAPPKSLFDVPITTPSIFGGNGTPTPSANNIFKSNPSVPSVSIFGTASTEKKDEPAGAKSTNIFSSAPSNSAPIFSFGAAPAAPTAPAANNTQPSPAPPMIFGGNNTQSSGAEPKKLDFQFGASTPSGNSNPFAFGEGGSNSGSTGFTFTAGGGQSFNNPFASPTPPPAVSIFSDNSVPAPPSSASFTFGQQAPSTPKPPPVSQSASIFGQGPPMFGASSNGGNGAPSLSFTQATPPQNSPNPFAQKSTPFIFGGAGSLLPAGSDGAAGASSPFPAPSSMGTTPVNGTPEPQTQNEDGEEGTHEQISLTNGGPGEEDETILHEVRAKAIKYVPVVKGDDDDENKSPWSTQGVGPLRVLKNKTTGSVRVLLRAEPRGHIAMNKALLPDVEYKAKDKTVNFVASNEVGSGLETWVLQVKKPDFAQQLAGVLEANKSANKK
ncbi:hypothetical protein Hte_010387 [Hypoxylon texense]